MENLEYYIDLKGQIIPLASLDAEERDLLAALFRKAEAKPGWDAFTNEWRSAVASFYDGRGVARKESRRGAVYRVAQDLAGRMAIAEGKARAPDYRDELAHLIRERFPTRRAFCEATGLSEDMLSHVLARRKHLAIDTLAEALDRIGVDVRLVPREPANV
jgi:hypothetical protein